MDKISGDVDKIASASMSGFGNGPDGKKMEQQLHDYSTTGCNGDGLKASATEQKKTVQSYKEQLQKGFKQLQEQDQLNAKGISSADAGDGSGEGLGGGASKSGKGVVGQAEQLLGKNASDLKKAGIGMDPNVPSDVCCANFVSAMLQREGLINFHSNGVADLSARLQAQGWHVSSNPPPGAVAIIINSSQHVELYAGNGRLIGSNNSNSDGSQRVGYGNPYGSIMYLVPPGY